MKKSLLLLLFAICSLASWAANRDDTFCNNILCYKITSSTTVMVVGVGESEPPTGDFSIPESVLYQSITYSVTVIGPEAFYGCSGLTSLTIPNSVTYIEERAFYGCTGLTSVFIPNSVTSIGINAFYGVKKVLYCGTATDAPWGALRAGCFYTEGDFVFADNTKTTLVGYIGAGGRVTIPNSVTTVEDHAFSGCTTLTAITIPNSVTTVGDYAFSGCTGLKMVSIGESVTQIGNHTFEGCTNVDTMYYNAKNLGNTLDWFIPDFGFRPMQLDTLVIGNKVQSLPEQIFTHQSQLSSVTIPNSVKSIGIDAFSTCSNLSNINFGDSLTTIGQNAFDHCNFTNITLPNSLTGIGDYAFSNCENLTSVTFGNALTCIGAWTFSVCDNLDNVTVPNSVTDIGVGAFSNGVKTVLYCGTAEGAPWGAVRAGCFYAEGDFVFANDTKTTLVGYIGAGGRVTIPNSVTTIADSAFLGHTQITALTIPNSVTTVGDRAFSGCTGLKMVSIGESVTQIGNHSFEGCINVDTMYYNAKNLETYRWYNDGYGFLSMQLDTLVIGNKVQSLPDDVFYNQNDLTSVTFPNSLTTIQNDAFSECGRLSHVSFGDSLTTIGINAFDGCGFTNITFPNSLTSIADHAFKDCRNLTSVTFGNSLISIGTWAFMSCDKLDNVIIPNSVTSIGGAAFDGVKTVLYCGTAEGAPWGAVRAGCFYAEGDFVFADNTKTTLVGYIGDGGRITIPNSVTTIADSAFFGHTQITALTITNSVTTVGDRAFSGCTGLKMVSIGESVTQIGNFTFEGCTDVDTLYYNAKNLDNTDDWAFENYGFQPMQFNTLVIGNKVQSLPEEGFSNQNNLTSVTIPNSVKIIGNGAFHGCESLNYINFGDSLTTIGFSAFAHCNFTNIVIPNSVTSIKSNAFYDCDSLRNVSFGDSLTSIGSYVFSLCYQLDNVPVPSSVTTIGVDAFFGVKTVLYCGNAEGAPWGAQKAYGALQDSLYFKDCDKTIVNGYVEGLASANIPDGVTTIDSNAFKNCSTLTSVTIPPSMTSIGNHAFEGCVNIDTLHYNAKNLSATSNWYNSSESNNSYGFRSMTLDTLVIGDSVKTLPYGVFYNQSALSSITIPYSVTSIGSDAFYGCSGLTTLTIPNSVTSVGSYAFGNCSGLSSITLPNSLTSIESGSFLRCSNLTSISIPNSVTEIRTYAFMECGGLTSVSIGSAVTKIETNAFEGCTNVVTLYYNAKRLNTTGSATWDNTDNCGFRPMPLQTLVIGDSVETLPNYVFAGQANLSNIIIPNSVKTIGENAFRSNSNLTSLTIPNSVTSIGGSAFYGCHNLAHVSIPNSITTINGYTFNGCSSLQSIVIPSSVISITSYAFDGCSNLKTVYNLSTLPFTKNSTDNGYVAKYALRVLSKDNGFTDHGTGSNTLHQISTSYTVVDEETGGETTIPRSTIPTNFIYYDGSNAKSASDWKANAIDLSDDTCRFFAPVAFTADTASYSRSFTNGNRSTLYLPFSAPIPDDFEVYAFSNYDNSTFTLNFSPVADSIQAHTPYLVGYGLSKAEHTTCTITATDIRFPATSDAATPEPSNGMTFQGTTARTCMSGTNYGYSNGFFVRSGNGSDHSAHAHVNPFRAYFSFTGAPAQMPPVTLGVGFDSSPLGIETPGNPNNNSSSIRYSNDVYDLMGRLVRTNAHTLLGLPNGIYIWRGQKLLHHNP